MSYNLSFQSGLFVDWVAMQTSLDGSKMRGKIIRFIYQPNGWRSKVNPHMFKREKHRFRQKERELWHKENLGDLGKS